MYIHGAYFKNVIQVYSINAFTEFNKQSQKYIYILKSLLENFTLYDENFYYFP